MNLKGGYQIIDLKETNLPMVEGSAVKIEGIDFKTIESIFKSKKPVLVKGFKCIDSLDDYTFSDMFLKMYKNPNTDNIYIGFNVESFKGMIVFKPDDKVYYNEIS